MTTKHKIIFWITAAVILGVAVASVFFALRKPAPPPNGSNAEVVSQPKDNGVELTSLAAAESDPSAAFRLNLRYVSNGTTTYSAGGVASTTGTSTQLTQIPAGAFSLVNLTLLNLAGNRLTNVPPEIGNLKNLQVLYLGNNQLTSIPDAICGLSHLRLLSLFQNNITGLPPCLSGMANLRTIGLSGNPLPTSTVVELKNRMASTTVIF
jgi:Leucine-rich repeat (LRR) protein